MTISLGRKPSVPDVCLPFQERHFGTGKAWKHPGTTSLQPGQI